MSIGFLGRLNRVEIASPFESSPLSRRSAAGYLDPFIRNGRSICSIHVLRVQKETFS